MSSPSKISLADQIARDRIRNDLDTTLIVEAAAGTGKTTALIGRILSGIVAGRIQLDRLVAVTFTEFAAGELKLRLRAAIEQARKDYADSPEILKLLRTAVEQLEEARIGTIHSFCADLLREHPVEAGIDPLFEVAPDEMTSPLFDLAFERWFEKQLAGPSDAVRRILRRPQRRGFGGARTGTLARRPHSGGPRPILRAAALSLVRERDFTTPWRAGDAFNRESLVDEIIEEMKDLADWSDRGDPSQWFTRSLKFLKSYVADLTRIETLGQPRDYDGIEARLFSFLGAWKTKHYKAYYTRDNFPKDDLMRRRDELKLRVEEFLNKAGADLAPRLRDELWPVVETFEELKERAGYVDFLDLLLRARNLIRDSVEVRRELQERFTHIFVDEFQDTDPLQAEMLLLLAASDTSENDWRKVQVTPGKLFIVGDPKQSIYRFRRADVRLYQEIKRHLIAAGGALVELNVSFRAAPQIQTAVNAAFEPVMSESSSTQAEYVPLLPFRSDIETQPSIVALPVSQPYGDFGKFVDRKIEESQPKDVAAFIAWLVNESGWTITERENPQQRVPIQPRHICLLFRRLRHYATDVTRTYVQALETHQIPHLLVGGSSFHSREEVEAIRNALTAIEWPDDEVAVYATLRGPLFAFTDAQLLSYRTIHSTLHPFKPASQQLDSNPRSQEAGKLRSGSTLNLLNGAHATLPLSDFNEEPNSGEGDQELNSDLRSDLSPNLTEIRDALTILRELHRQRNRQPISETITTLLARTRAHAGFANWPNGEQALANILRLTDMARRAERNGMISFRAFIDWLEDEAESGDAGDAPIIEEGVDGVRIMTVHKAKGLEFPVVILVDITAKDAREPSKWVDQTSGLHAMRLAGCTPIEVQEHAEEENQLELEEAARVLYVAATRARDLLVVSALGDEEYDGWLRTLNPILYPEGLRSFNPETNKPIGCPEFGKDPVIDRPNNAFRKMGSVTPGLHKPLVGNHRVIWWDPAALPLGSDIRAGSRLTPFLKEDDLKVHSTEGIESHNSWQKTRSEVRSAGSKPEWVVTTATAPSTFAPLRQSGDTIGSQSVALKEPDTPVTVQSLTIDFSRPHGKRFGSLVHAVLSSILLDADPAAISAAAKVQARILGATEVEVTAATETVRRALDHPLLRRAAKAFQLGHARKEMPVALRLEGESSAEASVEGNGFESDEVVESGETSKTEIIVEGIVDLAFFDPDRNVWTVIDYKTDFEIEGRLDDYVNQVLLYSQAISKATGLSTEGFLLRL